MRKNKESSDEGKLRKIVPTRDTQAEQLKKIMGQKKNHKNKNKHGT